MNNNERILHILDQSTCLTRRQMKDYLGGTMLPEEIHAAEMHISSCPLCSMALDGFDAHSDEALEAIASLNSGFLKEHFDSITPKIHLNSIAPAASFSGKRKKKNSISLLRISGVAAALLLGFGVLWYMDHRNNEPAERAIAKNEAEVPPASQTSPPAQTEREVSTKNALVATPATKEQPKPVVQEAKNDTKDEVVATETPAFKAMAAPPIAAAPTATNDATTSHAASVNVNDVASVQTQTYQSKSESGVSLGGGRVGSGSAYVPDGVVVKEEDKKAPVTASRRALSKPLIEPTYKKSVDNGEDHLEKGDESFDNNKYSTALAHYNKEIGSSDYKRSTEAKIGAAQCYIHLGNKKKAISLLQSVADNASGSQKRRAKRMLRDLLGE